MKYPNKLKEYRLARELLQQDVAIYMNLKSTSRLSKWERGIAMPSVANAMKLAAFYKVQVSDFYY